MIFTFLTNFPFFRKDDACGMDISFFHAKLEIVFSLLLPATGFFIQNARAVPALAEQEIHLWLLNPLSA